jgi:hypothetical protein
MEKGMQDEMVCMGRSSAALIADRILECLNSEAYQMHMNNIVHHTGSYGRVKVTDSIAFVDGPIRRVLVAHFMGVLTVLDVPLILSPDVILQHLEHVQPLLESDPRTKQYHLAKRQFLEQFVPKPTQAEQPAAQ